MPGPADRSTNNYVKLSFKEGLDPSFMVNLTNAIMKRVWETDPPAPSTASDPNSQTSPSSSNPPRIKPRTGIIGIERGLQEQQRATDESITIAFQDLRKLMGMAKDMVAISKTISAKIRVTVNECYEK